MRRDSHHDQSSESFGTTDGAPDDDACEDRELPDEADTDDDPDAPDTSACPACGHEAYDLADRCPHCGQYVTADELGTGGLPAWVWAAAAILLAGILVIIFFRGAL